MKARADRDMGYLGMATILVAACFFTAEMKGDSCCPICARHTSLPVLSLKGVSTASHT